MAIKIVEYKDLNRNTLKAFFSLRMTTIGLEIKGVALHEKPDGKRWVQLPTKPYQKTDGSTAYTPVVDFYDKGRERQFQKLTLEALDKYRATTRTDEKAVF